MRKRILQLLMFMLVFTSWDFYIRDSYYSFVAGSVENIRIGDIAFGYGMCFIVAYSLSYALAHHFGFVEEEAESKSDLQMYSS